MLFYYLGQPRECLWFDSPNHCATIVAMLLLIAIGLFRASYSNNVLHRWVIFFLGITIVWLTLVLILTYSRGGWVAYVSGLAFLALCTPSFRTICLLCSFGFIVGIALVPEGIDRAKSVTDPQDHSITNRIEVWKGALAMTADHPLEGVGADHFGTRFSAWYQPQNMNTRYAAALNNYLTISAERGISALICYLIFLFTPFYLTHRLARLNENIVMLGFCSGIVAYAISALFTNSLGFWHVSLFACIIWATLVFYIIKTWLQNRKSIDWKLTLFPITICLIISALLLGLGNYFLAAEPTRVKPFTFNETGQNQNAVIIYPQNQPSVGVILYFHRQGENILDTAKDTLRPLALGGFTVVSVDYRLQGHDGLNDASALLNWASNQPEFKRMPLFLCGSGFGGRLSILTACRQKEEQLKAVVSVGADVDWPFPDLSPLRQINNLSIPLLLLYSKDDDINTIEPQRMLSEATLQGKNVQLIITSDDSHSPSTTLNNALTFCFSNR